MSEKTKKVIFYCQIVIESLLLISCISMGLDLINVWQNIYVIPPSNAFVTYGYGRMVFIIELITIIFTLINIIIYILQFLVNDKVKVILNKINQILLGLSTFTLIILFVIAYTSLNRDYVNNSTDFNLSNIDYAVCLALQISILKIVLLMIGLLICYYLENRTKISKKCSIFRVCSFVCCFLFVIFGVLFGYTSILGNEKEFDNSYCITKISEEGHAIKIHYDINVSGDFILKITDGDKTESREPYSYNNYFSIYIKNINNYKIKIMLDDGTEISEFKPNYFNTSSIICLTLSLISFGGFITLYVLSKSKTDNEELPVEPTMVSNEN